MRALPFPAGIGIVNKAAVKNWLDHVAERVVQDAVAEGSGTDRSLLGISDDELAVAAMDVGALQKVTPQRQKVFFEGATELQDRASVAFRAPCLQVRIVEIREGGDVFDESRHSK